MGLTVKGQPATAQQLQIATVAIAAGKLLGASSAALQACIYAAMGESSLGADAGAGQNVWQANNPGEYGPAPNWSKMATAFFNGTNDFQAGGAIACANRGDPVWMIANEVEDNKVWIDSRGDSCGHEWLGGQAQGLAEAQAIVAANGGGTIAGTPAGLGGTGTLANQVSNSLWTVGDPSNPDQDYWTTFNQYCMDAQWYGFSDGETLYAADGTELMAQTPQGILSRLDPSVVRAECTYDNTAFMYASTHTRKARIPRKTSLARLTSPTMVTVRVICDIDKYRAGDTVILQLFGPADGPWLIGDCTRSVFQPYSDLTLVQAMAPINAASGLTSGPNYLTGKQASQPGSGTVIAAMLTEAATISKDDYPYVYGGGHSQAGAPSGSPKGFDCSGAVAAVLAAGGLWPWGSSVPDDAGVISQLRSNNFIVPGQGTGRPECTLFDNPGTHIFMRLNGTFFGTSDGDDGNASQPNGGAGWLYDSHSDASSSAFHAYHVPVAILGQQVTAAAVTPG